MTQGKETKELTIYDRLSRLQKHLKAPKEANKGVQYKSRSAEQILEAAKDNLLDGEYILLNDEIQFVGSRYYVKATATFGFGDKVISCTGWAHEEVGSSPIKGAQLTGACSSYARKYALGGLTALDDSRDDPDKQPEHTEKPVEKQPVKLTGDALLIADAMNSATSEKMLTQIGTVRKADIDKMPDDVKHELKLVYSRKLADLKNLTMAG